MYILKKRYTLNIYFTNQTRTHLNDLDLSGKLQGNGKFLVH